MVNHGPEVTGSARFRAAVSTSSARGDLAGCSDDCNLPIRRCPKSTTDAQKANAGGLEREAGLAKAPVDMPLGPHKYGRRQIRDGDKSQDCKSTGPVESSDWPAPVRAGRISVLDAHMSCPPMTQGGHFRAHL
jgi:hypothetical protein